MDPGHDPVDPVRLGEEFLRPGLATGLSQRLAQPREVLMGEGNGVASVTMLTFTKRPGPHADTAWAVVG